MAVSPENQGLSIFNGNDVGSSKAWISRVLISTFSRFGTPTAVLGIDPEAKFRRDRALIEPGTSHPRFQDHTQSIEERTDRPAVSPDQVDILGVAHGLREVQLVERSPATNRTASRSMSSEKISTRARLMMRSCSTCRCSAQGTTFPQATMFCVGIMRRPGARGARRSATGDRAGAAQARSPGRVPPVGRARSRAASPPCPQRFQHRTRQRVVAEMVHALLNESADSTIA